MVASTVILIVLVCVRTTQMSLALTHRSLSLYLLYPMKGNPGANPRKLAFNPQPFLPHSPTFITLG